MIIAKCDGHINNMSPKSVLGIIFPL